MNCVYCQEEITLEEAKSEGKLVIAENGLAHIVCLAHEQEESG